MSKGWTGCADYGWGPSRGVCGARRAGRIKPIRSGRAAKRPLALALEWIFGVIDTLQVQTLRGADRAAF